MNNYTIPHWPAPACIKAYTTVRTAGYSNEPYHSFNLALHVGDNELDVLNNREKLKNDLKLPAEPKWINQTHSNIAVLAKTISDKKVITADASYTQENNTVCAVLTADCMPILVTNQAGTEIAAIHAGWKGLADGIIESALSALKSSLKELLIWIGPSISQAHYEVGKDFYDAFISHHTEQEIAHAFHRKPTSDTLKWLADVPLLATQRLTKLGVLSKNIYLSHECTYKHADRYFSYRRDGITGRIASLIWIEK